VAVKFFCIGGGGKIVSGLILTLPPPLPLQCVGTFTPNRYRLSNKSISATITEKIIKPAGLCQ